MSVKLKYMSRKSIKKTNQNFEYNDEKQNRNEEESGIPYRRSLIIQQFNDFKLIIQNQEEQIKEAKEEIKLKDQQLENEVKIRNDLNSKIFDCERRINDLESIYIFQKNEIEKKDKKILLLDQEIKNLKSRRGQSNDFVDQEAKDMIDHLSKELDEKDDEIKELKSNIQTLIKRGKKNTLSNKDNLLDSNDSYSETNDEHLANSKKKVGDNTIISKTKQLSNSTNPNFAMIDNSTASTNKGSTSNSKNGQFGVKSNKQYRKIKVKRFKSDKIKNDKLSEVVNSRNNEIDINIDLVTEKDSKIHHPRYKSKSPPRLDISTITSSQMLISHTPAIEMNKKNNSDYDEEEDLPNTSRSAYPQNKNNILKDGNAKNINAGKQRKLEREFKSDDDLIKPKVIKTKRITRKNKKVIKHSSMPKVNNLKDDKNNNDINEDQNLNDSETSQSVENKRKPVRRLRKRSISPNGSDQETQKMLKSSQNIKNINNKKKLNKINEELKPQINFDDSSAENSNDEENEIPKANTLHPIRSKKITRKTVKRRVVNSQRKNTLKKVDSNNNEDYFDNDVEDQNKNNQNEKTFSLKKKNKKRRIIKKKVTQEVNDDKIKNLSNSIKNKDDESSSSSLDSKDFDASQKLDAIHSIKAGNENNTNQKEFAKTIPSSSNSGTNTARSRAKPRQRVKAKTIYNPKQNLNNIQPELKQQQSQPQMPQPKITDGQIKPQNYGNDATIASRAAWLNRELFGQSNNLDQNLNDDNENLEELFEQVIAINKAIVRNPRRGVARRPPTILKDN